MLVQGVIPFNWGAMDGLSRLGSVSREAKVHIVRAQAPSETG